ncbi:MAG: DAK2 domain-containing protein [Clostridia bacterium]|nr:DAK2 domain-containing protein [Clostridia bacterium]
MRRRIDGECFRNMVEYAVRNLNKHVKHVNELNVFPVPDGDTGTNMVTTIHKGLLAVGETIVDLPSVARRFARSVVFEARGNSGVIVSQFLKGISEGFYDVDAADAETFIAALEKGVKYAYASVATPVEGTMLTVVKDATNAVKKDFDSTQSVDDVIDSFVRYAKRSLESTPELLSVLKERGVVDSGGAGIVYMFEGMKKYLDGEDIDGVEEDKKTETVDYDAFGPDSSFEFGYCTELLLQLLNGREDFDPDSFKSALSEIGDSLVLSHEKDKARIHIHTRYPEKVFELCHKYGEFLSLKIENMTVQHTEQSKRIMCSPIKNNGAFSIVAVAYDQRMQQLFIDMGADVSVLCEEGVSTKDYLDAFEMSGAENIFVFPNSSDAILSAVQAKKLYAKAKVTVINSRTVAECYAALPTVDFSETDIETAQDSITQIINNLYVVSIAKRNSAVRYGDKDIHRNEYYSFSGKELISISDRLEETTAQTIYKVIKQQNREIVTIFYQSRIKEQTINSIIELVSRGDICAEFFSVPTDSLPCLMTISFE